MSDHFTGNRPGQRSTFVTALAWSFIVLAALSVFSGFIQFLLVQIFVDQEALRAGMRTEHSMENLPETVRFVFSNVKLLTAAFLGLSVALLTASIGLLKRQNWARWLFIVFMVLGVVAHLAPLAGGPEILTWTAGLLTGTPEAMQERLQGFIGAAWLVFAFLSLLLAAVFAWIGWKLTRPEISAEFTL